MALDAVGTGAKVLGMRDAAAPDLVGSYTPGLDALDEIKDRNQPIGMSRLQAPAPTPAPVPNAPSVLGGRGIGTEMQFPRPAPTQQQPRVNQLTGPSGATLKTPSIGTTKEGDIAKLIGKAQDSRKTRMEETAKNLNRSGVAKIRAAQLEQRKALSEKNAGDRKENRLYDLLARAGGQGPLADIGRAASDLRQGDRMQADLDLANEFAREDKGIADDIKIGTEEIQAGDRLEQIVATASTAELNRISSEAIANLSASSRASVARYKAVVQRETNSLKQQADKVKSKNDSRKLLLDVQKQLSKIKLDSEERVNKLIEQNTLATGSASKEEVDNMRKNESLRLYKTLLPEIKALQDLFDETKNSLSGFTVKKIK